MDMNIIHTLKPRKHDGLIEALLSKSMTSAQQDEVVAVLREHQAVIAAATRLRNKQIRSATCLLGALEKGETLFPVPEKKPDAPNETGSDPEPSNGEPEKPIALKKGPRKPAKVVGHKLELCDLKCPCCQKSMHKAHKKTVTIIRVDGFSEERHEIETARCLTCDTKAEAAGPTEKTILQFSIKAAAVVTSLRYIYGVPSYRLEEVSQSMGYRIPDSTQWDLFEAVANELQPFHRFLKKEASNAGVVQMDDTTARVNELSSEFALAKLEGRKLDRTGVHTTGFIAKFATGKICLFDSGLHHAGEYFEKVMKAKTTEEQVILMVDASTSNTCKLSSLPIDVVQANCNSHVVRRFDEQAENPLFEKDAGEILKLYKDIFDREQKIKDLSPEERLEIHKNESLPQMQKIKEKIESDFASRRVEHNSNLGDAYKYFLNHFHKLCAFCTVKGAPVCNNETERLLKRAIRHRKNSLFYKTLSGAAVGDIHMTILMTAKENGLEPVQYLIDLLKHADKVKVSPKDWLPWNYPKTMESLLPTESSAA